MAFALLFLSIERLAGVIPISEANSPEEILRFAIITSRLTIIGIFNSSRYIVKSFSVLIITACSITFLTTRNIKPKNPAATPPNKNSI